MFSPKRINHHVARSGAYENPLVDFWIIPIILSKDWWEGREKCLRNIDRFTSKRRRKNTQDMEQGRNAFCLINFYDLFSFLPSHAKDKKHENSNSFSFSKKHDRRHFLKLFLGFFWNQTPLIWWHAGDGKSHRREKDFLKKCKYLEDENFVLRILYYQIQLHCLWF